MDAVVVTPPPERVSNASVKRRRQICAQYVTTGIVAILGAFWALRWKLADLDQPLRVGESDLSTIYALADVFQAPFVYSSSEYGYPFSANFAVQVVPDDVTNTLIGLMKVASGSPIIAVNSFILLSFALTTTSMIWLLRQYVSATYVRVLFALSAAWMPYVFVRVGYGHILLAAIWPIPLAIGLIIRTIQTQYPSRKELMSSCILAALVGSSSAYYGFFGSLILGILLTGSLPQRRDSTTPRWMSAARFLIVPAFLFPVVARVLAMRWMGLEETIVRSAAESLTFAGRLTQAFFPWGFPYMTPPELTAWSEFEWSPIHLLGALGVWAALLSVRSSRPEVRVLAAIIVIAMAFFTSGGLGYAFSITLTPSFRAWSRLMPFVTVASLALCAIGVQSALKGAARSRYVALSVALILPISLQIVDARRELNSPLEARAPAHLLTPYLSGTSLLSESRVSNCPVLQTPVMRAFEGGDVGAVKNGDHYWPGVVSRDLIWTYGAIKGTTAGEFLPRLNDADSSKVIRWVEAESVCSVWVDSRASQISVLSNPSSWTGNGLLIVAQFGGQVLLSQ